MIASFVQVLASLNVWYKFEGGSFREVHGKSIQVVHGPEVHQGSPWTDGQQNVPTPHNTALICYDCLPWGSNYSGSSVELIYSLYLFSFILSFSGTFILDAPQAQLSVST